MRMLTTAAVSALILSGCSQLAKNYAPDPILSQKSPKAISSYILEDETVNFAEAMKASELKDAEKRHQFMVAVVALSNQKCERHKATIISNTKSTNLVAGVASVLFSGYASVTESASKAAHFSAAATATSGIQGQFNQEIYSGKLAETIIRAIDAGRSKYLAPISDGMKSDSYAVSAFMMDVDKYHNSCSLMAGLSELTSAIENRPPSSAEILAKINFINQTMPRGTLDPAVAAAYKSALTRLEVELASARN